MLRNFSTKNYLLYNDRKDNTKYDKQLVNFNKSNRNITKTNYD